jgi:hypothetical protein
MTDVDIKPTMSEIIGEVKAISRDAWATFGHLSAEQINWKPSAESWGVGQCFEHLISANREFYPQFDQIANNEKRTTLWQRVPFLPGFFWSLLVKAVAPNSSDKFKAPKKFRPSSSDVDPKIIEQFLLHQDEVIELIEKIGERELDRIIIYSPVTKVIIYSLLDAYRIIVLHERRHFQQAERVMAMPGFPN